MASYDYLLDENGDLLFRNGDLVVGISDNQHVADTINAFPGWWKQYPGEGVGILAYYKSRIDRLSIENKIKQQLEIDGYVSIPEVKFNNGTLEIDPHASRL